MIDALRSLLLGRGASPADSDPEQKIRVAVCALLLELAHADHSFDDAERAHLEVAMAQQFGLDPDGAREVIALAERERHDANDVYPFTAVLRRHYDERQRLEVVETFWRMAHADGVLSQHEESLARGLAKLLDLPPGWVADARNRATRTP